MKRTEVLLILALGVFALPLMAADMSSVAGVWGANSVNGHSIPGQAFTRSDGGKECFQDTVGTTLLFDSSGNWSGLITYRNRCKGDAAPKKGGEQSVLVHGTYELNGQALALFGSGEPMRGAATADEITLLLNGVGDYAAESATFTFKRRK